MTWELVRHFFEQGFERSSRSTVLSTLLTMAGILSGALLVSGLEGGPTWMQVFFAFWLSVDVGLFAWAYLFFAKRNPDALRSERFLTHKMAIERGVLGDKLSGVIAADVVGALPRAIEEAPKQIEDNR